MPRSPPLTIAAIVLKTGSACISATPRFAPLQTATIKDCNDVAERPRTTIMLLADQELRSCCWQIKDYDHVAGRSRTTIMLRAGQGLRSCCWQIKDYDHVAGRSRTTTIIIAGRPRTTTTLRADQGLLSCYDVAERPRIANSTLLFALAPQRIVPCSLPWPRRE